MAAAVAEVAVAAALVVWVQSGVAAVWPGKRG